MVTLYKLDARNRARYVTIHTRQPSLFGDHIVTVRHGMVSGTGTDRNYTYESREEMDRALRRLLKRKARQGYRVIYRYVGSGEKEHLRSQGLA